jgi:hypothetical protein
VSASLKTHLNRGDILLRVREEESGEKAGEIASNSSEKGNGKKSTRKIVSVSAKSPACSSCSIPVLSVLAREPSNGMRARDVIREVRGWFDHLSTDDLEARYPESRKKITDTVIKFSKKNLTLKKQIFPAGNESIPLGVWKITHEGIKRLDREKASWQPRYSFHEDAILIVRDDTRNEDENGSAI